jgi:biopolymer transport protein ExbD
LLLVRALAVVLILLMLFFVYIFFSNRSVDSKIESTSAQIQKDQNEIAENSDRQRLLTRQAQLKEAKVIITNHVFWSRNVQSMQQLPFRSFSAGGEYFSNA